MGSRLGDYLETERIEKEIVSFKHVSWRRKLPLKGVKTVSCSSAGLMINSSESSQEALRTLYNSGNALSLGWCLKHKEPAEQQCWFLEMSVGRSAFFSWEVELGAGEEGRQGVGLIGFFFQILSPP